ncbi:MAG: aminoacetone oxidase family FAD-binding enzyme [Candidatus Omnitrophica bacterium]|nr:aminoacetone oxidase family FAD-binding enzyme [Candidatus Omnitrophota bacterium]
MNNTYDLIIIGAGATGLMCAAEAGQLRLKTLVLEGQPKPGAKILMSGGGRCNASNIRVTEQDYATNGSIHTIRHVLKIISSDDVFMFFERWGAPLVLEQDGKYFSADGRAMTVLQALLRAAKEGDAEILCSRRVSSVALQNDTFNVVAGTEVFEGRAVVVATGGISYPQTGSSGFGYALAKSFGHQIVSPQPALTPFKASRDIFSHLQGIALPVRLTLWLKNRKERVSEGPLLFTHLGFSGPAVFDMSRHWVRAKEAGNTVLTADFLPFSKKDGLGFEDLPPLALKKTLKNFLGGVFPERLSLTLIKEAGLDPASSLELLSKDKKKKLALCVRAFPLPIEGVFGFDKAEVTSGGVSLEELEGATLESRLQPGLYFAGEVLDADGRVGGFNLHWAWASGQAVARAIARKKEKGAS